jgi:hypothetical protein
MPVVTNPAMPEGFIAVVTVKETAPMEFTSERQDDTLELTATQHLNYEIEAVRIVFDERRNQPNQGLAGEEAEGADGFNSPIDPA